MSVVYNVCVKMKESAWFFHLKMLVLFFFSACAIQSCSLFLCNPLIFNARYVMTQKSDEVRK